jgi:hypothetical protein
MPASRFAAWAGAPTESAVTRVTKVAETPNPSFSAALGAAAEVTRAAVPKVTGVTVPNPSAIEVTQVTQRPTTRFPRKPVDDQYSNPGNPSNTQNVECPISSEVAADPAWWRGFSEERAAIREIDGGRRREEAAGLAFADVILKWHQRYGVRPDSRRCAGCGDELTGETGLVLCDGARVHLDGARGVKCAIAYGLKWRGAAVAALRVLGLDPPRGFTLL